MKEQLILWLSSVVITFLVLYLGNLTGGYYPLSGTIGIDGQRVTYKMDKINRGNNDYKVTIVKDISGGEAFLLWRKTSESKINRIKMIDSSRAFEACIPSQPPLTRIEYQVQIIRDNKNYFLPNRYLIVPMLFLGAVPSSIMNLYYFFLYGGILLSVRGALEYFNKNRKLKVYTMFTAIFFFCYTVAVTPLKSSYELGAIAHSVPSVEKLFNLQAVLLFIIWMIGMVSIIGSRKPGIRAIVFALITILIYLLVPIKY